MNGYETINEIKKIVYKIPIIAQTAYAMVDDRENILSKGFDYYIAKPIQINTLLDVVSKYIN
jgi:CheY-like chemotaxis protein